MKFIIIGTAGHVDHGKSTLIKGLTGIETDRLLEEKLRGISIELGFASMKLDEKIMASIVDVPGHERFLKNMLAGTGGIDLALLIIAADEGVMPQTKEHLAMLQLYGIKYGLVVITKSDKVDTEWLDLVEEEVKNFLAATFLAKAPLCRVSAITGEGLEQLKVELRTIAARITPRDQEAPFRMWIDRIFTINGCGAVVTGSVLSGTIEVGNHLVLYPSQEQVRVRGMECHGHKLEKIVAGQRAAINVVGVEKGQIKRGMSICMEGCGEVSCVWDIMVKELYPVPSGTRVRVHLGTAELLGRTYSFKDGGNEYKRLILEEPLAACAGDKGILRLYSPQKLLGGLMLIAPNKEKKMIGEVRKALSQALKKSEKEQLVQMVLHDAGNGIGTNEIIRRTGCMNKRQVEESLAALEGMGQIAKLDDYYIDKKVLKTVADQCRKWLKEYHRIEPLRAGLGKERIKQQLRVGDKVFEKIMNYWEKEGSILKNCGGYALPEHMVSYNRWYDELFYQLEEKFNNNEIISIDIHILSTKLNLVPDQAKEVYEILLDKGVLIQIDNICIYRKTMQYIMLTIKQYFQRQESFTISQLRDMLNTSRKMILPILKYLDMNKYTIRAGDIHFIGPQMVYFSEE